MRDVDGHRIDEYANSMFRFEQLTERWIASCAAYLRSLFGETLRDKTVIDYAFGRGNWSLAFRAAGASKVIAIDASSAAVARFRDHCRVHGIRDIEVLQGDVLTERITATGDLIWLYGIVPMIEDQTAFLTRARTLAAGPDAEFYVYHHNADSLREFTVETCRTVLTYESESAFRDDDALFVRPARIRARDDLAAPYLKFSTASELRELLRGCGLYVTRQDLDFQHFLQGKTPEDFSPHQFLCSMRPEDEVEVIKASLPHAEEAGVLGEIARDVLALPVSEDHRKKIAIGLFNTHFAFLRDGVDARESVIEMSVFLLHALLRHDVDEGGLGPRSARYYAAFRAALAGVDPAERRRLLTGAGDDNEVAAHLVHASIRV